MNYYLISKNNDDDDATVSTHAILVTPSQLQIDLGDDLKKIRNEYEKNRSARHWFNDEFDYILFRLEQKYEGIDGFQLIDKYHNVIIDNFTLVE